MKPFNRLLLSFGLTLSCVAGAIGGFCGLYSFRDGLRVLADSPSYSQESYKVDFFNLGAFNNLVSADLVESYDYVPHGAFSYVSMDNKCVAFLGSVIVDSSNHVLAWRWYTVDDDVSYSDVVENVLTSYTPCFIAQTVNTSHTPYTRYIYRLGYVSAYLFRENILPNRINVSFGDSAYFSFSDRTVEGKRSSTSDLTAHLQFNTNDVTDGEWALERFLSLSAGRASAEYSDGYGNGAIYGQGSVIASAQSEGYSIGREAGYSEGYNVGYADGNEFDVVGGLFGAVVDVPLQVLHGLTPLVIWDTPIVGIILTFMFVGLMLWVVKRFI